VGAIHPHTINLLKEKIYMATKKASTKTTKSEDLASVLAESLNSAYKDEGKVAFFLNEGDDPSLISDWIPTGSSLLDLAISNRPNGGIPVGRITEVTGLEQSGKSLLCGHILAETQKKGGVAVYIDTETSVSIEYLTAIGVDTSKLLYVHVDTVEDIFATIDNIIATIRKSNKDRLVTIVTDSVAAASTKVEMSADYSKDGFATTKAILISKAMRKLTSTIGRQKIALVFTNQLRQKMGVMFGDPWTTSGGKALAFHASVRLRLKNLGQIKQGSTTDVIGNKCEATIVKNRMGPPQRKASFEIYFNRGIDDLGSWITTLKTHKVFKQGGAYYTYVDSKENEHKFMAKEFPTLLAETPELKTELYNHICDKVVMQYESANSVIDEDVEFEDNDTIAEHELASVSDE
jgi:recombination protein RecA